MKRQRHDRRVVAAAVLAIALGACGSARLADTSQQQLESQIRARGLDPRDVIMPFDVDDEMRAWVHENVQTVGGPERRLEELLRAILSRDGTVLKYDLDTTRTAREVWRTNRADCLSFTHLYVALARELGLPVYYLRVSDLETFEKDGDLIVATDHITAAYGPPTARRVLDFTERPLPEYHIIEPLSDVTATALHYSNLGAQRIRAGAFADAEALLEVAVRLDPELGDGWVNLGVALRRLDRPADAEASFRQALVANPRLVPAYQNLASLLERNGRHEESQRLLELTNRSSNRNPFSYLALGDLALRQGQLRDAERFFRRALRLRPNDAEPLAALGQWALASGRRREAERWLAKARRVDPDHPRAGELARALHAANPATAASR